MSSSVWLAGSPIEQATATCLNCLQFFLAVLSSVIINYKIAFFSLASAFLGRLEIDMSGEVQRGTDRIPTHTGKHLFVIQGCMAWLVGGF